MTKLRRTILIGGSALLLTALLTGCGATNGNLGALIPTAPTAKVTSTPTPAAIPGDTDGNGRLSEFEKQVLASHAPKDYTMPDGSVVQIDPTQPLPAPVVAAVQANAVAVAAALTSGSGRASINAHDALVVLIQEQSAATGKGLVFVYETVNVDAQNGESIVWAMTPSDLSSTDVQVSQNLDEFLTKAHVWADARGYEVIVIR